MSAHFAPGFENAVEDLAAGCCRMVEHSLGFRLDYSLETLPVLDHFLGDMAKDEPKAESLVAPCAGAYFGEALRRQMEGARWVIHTQDYETWRLAFDDVGVSFNPLGAALERIAGENLAGWGAHLEVPPKHRSLVSEALQASGPVRADDYFRLAVRQEVLEQAVDLLREMGRRESSRKRRSSSP